MYYLYLYSLEHSKVFKKFIFILETYLGELEAKYYASFKVKEVLNYKNIQLYGINIFYYYTAA